MNSTELWKDFREYQQRRRRIAARHEADPQSKNHRRHARNAARYARRHKQPPIEYNQMGDRKFRRRVQ